MAHDTIHKCCDVFPTLLDNVFGRTIYIMEVELTFHMSDILGGTQNIRIP